MKTRFRSSTFAVLFLLSVTLLSSCLNPAVGGRRPVEPSAAPTTLAPLAQSATPLTKTEEAAPKTALIRAQASASLLGHLLITNSYAFDPTIKNLLDFSSHVAIVRVIEKQETQFPGKNSFLPETAIRVESVKNFKGELGPNVRILIDGGTVTARQYMDSNELKAQELDALNKMSAEGRESRSIDIYPADFADVCAGELYLFFLRAKEDGEGYKNCANGFSIYRYDEADQSLHSLLTDEVKSLKELVDLSA